MRRTDVNGLWCQAWLRQFGVFFRQIQFGRDLSRCGGRRARCVKLHGMSGRALVRCGVAGFVGSFAKQTDAWLMGAHSLVALAGVAN
eukprot:4124828-Prorocentrum_lima.AAC.1